MEDTTKLLIGTIASGLIMAVVAIVSIVHN